MGRRTGTRTKRQPSSDRIEADDSQRSQMEDVDGASDEERPQRRAGATSKAYVKKSRTSTKTKYRDDPEDIVEVEEREDDPIDVDDFRNQPLYRADAERIHGLAGDWEIVIHNIKESALEMVPAVAESMAEAALGDDREAADKELEQLEIVMRELLDAQAELECHRQTLEDINQSVKLGEAVTDVLDRYDSGVTTKREEWKARTSRQKYAKDEQYLKFRESIFNVKHPDEAMPPMTELIPFEDGDESDDDDVVVGGITQDLKCPLSLTLMKDPLKSSLCGHSFSSEAILQYLRSSADRGPKVKCPATGCNKLVGKNDFKPDLELARRIKGVERRARRLEAEADSENDDDEDIID